MVTQVSGSIERQVRDLTSHLERRSSQPGSMDAGEIHALSELAAVVSQTITAKYQIVLDRGQWLMRFGDQVVSFKRQPRLFLLLEMLSQSQEPVSKKALAEKLWPREIYRPLTIDPRLFDLVRRARIALKKSWNGALVIDHEARGYVLRLAPQT